VHQKGTFKLIKLCCNFFFHPVLFAEVWPPEFGRAFDTSILSWSFADQSFWRGSAIAMSEVVTFARSIASTRFREAIDEHPN